MAWRGPEEVEEMCNMFVTFLTTPAVKTSEEREKANAKELLEAAAAEGGKTPPDGRSSQMNAVREDVLGESMNWRVICNHLFHKFNKIYLDND